MSESKSSILGDLISNVKAGVSNLGNKPRTEPDFTEGPIQSALDETSPNSEQVTAAPGQQSVLDDDDMLEGPDQQAAPQTVAQRLSSLSIKQKVLLGVVVLVLAFAAKNQLDMPSTESASKPVAESPQNAGEDAPGAENANEDSAFKGGQNISSGLDGMDGVSEQADNLPDDDLNLSLQESTGEFGSPAVSTTENIHPLDTPVAPAATPGNLELPTPAAPTNAAASSADTSPQKTVTGTEEQSALAQAANTDLPSAPAGEEPSPFADQKEPAFDDGTLAGTQNSVVDSSAAAVPKDESTEKKLAALEALVKKQAASIKLLESDLANAKKDHSIVPPGKAKPVVHQSNSSQVRTSQPKQAARPKLCVKAVAQAARNCSSCVAHAFVINKGMETMVGHGDKIDGYRVSIVGDRLDLQGVDGTEPHKFWSSPNGCAY